MTQLHLPLYPTLQKFLDNNTVWVETNTFYYGKNQANGECYNLGSVGNESELEQFLLDFKPLD